MEKNDYNITSASAVVAEVARDTEDEVVLAVAADAEAYPMTNATFATATAATPFASMPNTNVTRQETNNNNNNNNNDDDDIKAMYATYDYSHDDNYIVHEATTVVTDTKAPGLTVPHNTPYTIPYDADMERRIADEATRRGRMLSEQEIQDIRHFNNYKVHAIKNQEQMNVALANQNALYQNYKEETGLTQTSNTIPYEAIGVPTTTSTTAATSEPEYFPGGTYGKGGYEISDYETSTYETKDYKFTEYKSVYDP